MGKRSRSGAQAVDAQDIVRAVDRLVVLGRGVGIRRCGKRQLVYSVPDELSPDPTRALEVAEAQGGRVSAEDLAQQLGWTAQRSEAALAYFIREGLCWVDTQDPSVKKVCWFPSLALAAQGL